jgi:hypothetical protein
VTGAELAARRIAAAAARNDFERERNRHIEIGGPEPDWHSWSIRLSGELGSVLDALDAG